MRKYILPLALSAGPMVLLFMVTGGSAIDQSQEGVDFFEKKIRPLLAANCYECHSAAHKQRSGLLLDNHASMLKGGENGVVVIPGKPEASRLIKAVRYTDPDLKMPPRGRLTDEQ
ncbi:MAG TPA: c-type cytochrome domain-containing protein, partial [Gemmataceae bacterium]|nr:c-type cytochrome domain-containing protein [Gemmataceae bacterium]